MLLSLLMFTSPLGHLRQQEGPENWQHGKGEGEVDSLTLSPHSQENSQQTETQNKLEPLKLNTSQCPALKD